jgi:cephalosporin-C deacetylase
MVNKMYRLISMIFCLLAVVNSRSAFAQDDAVKADSIQNAKATAAANGKGNASKDDDSKADDSKAADEISGTLSTISKNAAFDNEAHYTYLVKNPTDNPQEGTVSYQVTTETGTVLHVASINVKIGKKSSGTYKFDIPEAKPGFYKLNVALNISDYDDTTRRVFGIRPEEIRSQHPKPADFDQFWRQAKDELAAVKPNFKIIPEPQMNSDNRRVYMIQMQSLGNYTIRGWMTVPIVHDKNKKFSVLLGLPGYQVDLMPLMGLDDDLAIVSLNVRGQGTSRGEINTRKDEYIFYHVEDKNKYVMRGAIMDCIRAVDFICAQPNLKHDQILASGGSMGGYLALALAGLDKRVALCSAQNPILCDIRSLPGEVKWPVTSFQKYVATKPGLTFDKVLDNLDYYDGKNFATNIKCPIIMGIGLLDPYAPPNNEYAAFNGINSKKRLLVFRDLGHEVSQVYKNLEGRWMRDNFGLF